VTAANWALRTAPIVYRRSEPYSDIETTLSGSDDVAAHRKHVELFTAVRYLHIKSSWLNLPHWPMFSTPETSVHVEDKNREISPLEREEGYGGKDLEKR